MNIFKIFSPKKDADTVTVSKAEWDKLTADHQRFMLLFAEANAKNKELEKQITYYKEIKP